MQINKGDLLNLKRSVSMTYEEKNVHALVIDKTLDLGAEQCECVLLINGLERRAHVFIPRGRSWSKTKTIAHVFAPTRKEQIEKGLNIGNIWGDFDIIQVIRGE